MPIPSPTSAESEKDFVSRCISEIIDEYGSEKSAAICYNTYRSESKMSTQAKIVSKFREIQYKGINLAPEGEEGPCWSSYEQIGTKIIGNTEVPNCVPIKED